VCLHEVRLLEPLPQETFHEGSEIHGGTNAHAERLPAHRFWHGEGLQECPWVGDDDRRLAFEKRAQRFDVAHILHTLAIGRTLRPAQEPHGALGMTSVRSSRRRSAAARSRMRARIWPPVPRAPRRWQAHPASRPFR